MFGTRSISGSSAIGCSGESDSAKERSMNATPTLCCARLHLDLDVVEARLHLVRGRRLVLVDGLQVLGAAEARPRTPALPSIVMMTCCCESILVT